MLKALADYGGDFLPDLKLEDFSHERILRLLRLYSKVYAALDGFWYLAVMERRGNKEALACDTKVWKSITKYEMRRITEELNIHGNDVIALMKALQIAPYFQNMQYKIDIENGNRATFTVTHCPTLYALEREGKGRETEICNIVEPEIFKDYASFFSPSIQVRCLKSPPRKSKDEICCQWAFNLES